MFKNKKWLLGVAIVATIMAACAPAATATPAPTEAELTEEPTEEPTEEATEAPYDGMVVSADCEASGSKIQEIAAVDRLTVRFTLCSTNPDFLQKVAFSSFSIQPREYLESTGGAGDLLEHPIGTGPFVFTAWNRGESIEMTRFDDYWGEPAKAASVVFRWNPESSARLLELQAGTVDGIDNVDPNDLAAVEADPSLQLVPRDAFNVFYIGFTNTFAPWDDVRVRQAVAMGIDRQRIVDTFYPVGSEVASHFTPCSVANGCDGDAWYDFNLEAAKALMADAGFANGFATKLYYRDVTRGYLPQVSRVAEDIQAQLKENLGIDATIEVMASGEFIDAASAGSLDGIHLLGWTGDYPHITNFLDFHFSTSVVQFGDAFPEIYDNLTEGGKIADPAVAEPFYTDANNAIKELVPMVPVAHGASAVAYRADVEGGHASPLGNESFEVVSGGADDTFVWMQAGEPPNLYCGDETDGEALRACEQIVESLLAYEVGGTAVVPSLATGCEPNDDATVWTCTLRDGVKFHDGSDLDANDVVASWAMAWDASNPLHKGNTGAFEYMDYLWGIINKPAE